MEHYSCGVICILSLWAMQVYSEFYVDDTRVSLDDIPPHCQLAEPDINFTLAGPTITVPRELNIAENEEMWVGYTKTLKVLEYIGCVSENDLSNDVVSKSYRIQSDLGQCFSICRTQYFGVYNTTCYCFSSEILNLTTTRSTCLRSCNTPIGTACGGIQSYDVSVYKYVNFEGKLDNDGNDCGIYVPNSQSFSWSKCILGQLRKGLCECDALSPNGHETPRGFYYWTIYTRSCFANNCYPAVGNVSSNINGNAELWTGRVKVFVISTTNDSSQSHGYYGYLTRYGGTYQLRFTNIPSMLYKLRKTLCVKGTLSQNTTDLNTSENISTHSMANSSNENSEDTGSGLLAVYVSIPVVLLVIVAVLLLVARRKLNMRLQSQYKSIDHHAVLQKQHFEDFRKPTSTDTQCSENATGIPTSICNLKTDVTNAGCENDCVANPLESESQVYEYFVLESSNEYATVHEENVGNTIDEEYDTTNAILKRKRDKPMSANDYSTLGELQDDTYNHIGKDTDNCQEGVTDTLYSHRVKDEEYSTTADNPVRLDHIYNQAHYGGYT